MPGRVQTSKNISSSESSFELSRWSGRRKVRPHSASINNCFHLATHHSRTHIELEWRRTVTLRLAWAGGPRPASEPQWPESVTACWPQAAAARGNWNGIRGLAVSSVHSVTFPPAAAPLRPQSSWSRCAPCRCLVSHCPHNTWLLERCCLKRAGEQSLAVIDGCTCLKTAL